MPQTHLEMRKGTQAQAVSYCEKPDTRVDGTHPERYGQLKQQGARTDLDTLCRLIINGDSTPTDIMLESPATWCRNYRALDLLSQRSRNVVRRQWLTTVIFYIGNPGSGKSRTVHAVAPNAYVKDQSHKWWDGYCGESEVVIEDLNNENGIPISQMLQLLDRYPCNVEVKGGMVNFAPKTIYITANMEIDQCYPNASKILLEALRRRISKRILVGSPIEAEYQIISHVNGCKCYGCRNN